MSHLSLGVQESIIGIALCVEIMALGWICTCNYIYATSLLPVYLLCLLIFFVMFCLTGLKKMYTTRA